MFATIEIGDKLSPRCKYLIMAAKPNLSMTGPSVDPISVAVIANRLTAITKEMGQVMLLTSRSPIFSESRDFVTAIFDDACVN